MVVGATVYVSKRSKLIRYEVCFVQAPPTEPLANMHGTCQRLGYQTLIASMIHAKYPGLNVNFVTD